MARASLHRAGVAVGAFGLLILLSLGLRALARPLQPADHRLISDVVAQRTAGLTSLAHAASLLGRSWLLIPLTAILALALRRPISWRACGPLVAVLGADALQNAVKAIVQRPRPAVVHLEHVTGSSFPSGHATESAAVAVALFLLSRGRPGRERALLATVLALLALAVAVSRVYLGVHYPSDVVAGIVLGSLWALVAVRLTSG